MKLKESFKDYIKQLKGLMLIACLFVCCCTYAQYPNWAKKSSSSIFKITTYTDEGNEIGSASGFFIGENEGIAPYSIFIKAAKAIIVDNTGKESEVKTMIAANEIYDIARFNVTGKKHTPVTIAKSVAPAADEKAWLLMYAVKNIKGIEGTIAKAEAFRDSFYYYTLTFPSKEEAAGCPLFNAAGEVIGMIQQGVSQYDDNIYAVSADFAQSLKLSGFAVNDKALNQTNIKTAIPDDPNQAFLFLTLANSRYTTEKYKTLVDDYIAKYPESADGYAALAGIYSDENNYDEAQTEYEHAYSISPDQIYKNQESRMFISKALWLMDQEKYRDAVLAFNTSRTLTTDSLDDTFYYAREQAELKCRMYQQALNDLDTAISKKPKNELYYAEKARVHYMVGQYDEGIEIAAKCVGMKPEYDVAYLVLGLCHIGKGNKEEGLKNLEKAQELGNLQAQALIEKYKQ